MSNKLLSIITINYNDLEGLKKTMTSVFDQSFQDYEYIIIDGGSSDGSAKCIENSQSKLAYWISEDDNGVYDAMNKGIHEAHGEYILFLNSGDLLTTNKVLTKVVPELKSGEDFISGNIIFKKENGEENRYQYPDRIDFSFMRTYSLGHPCTFIKRTLFDTYGRYRTDLKIVSDWEFFIKTLCLHSASYKHISEDIAIFFMDGMSNAQENKALILKERNNVLNEYFKPFLHDYKRLENLIQFEQKLKFLGFDRYQNVFKNKMSRKIIAVFVKGLNIFVR